MNINRSISCLCRVTSEFITFILVTADIVTEEQILFIEDIFIFIQISKMGYMALCHFPACILSVVVFGTKVVELIGAIVFTTWKYINIYN